MWVQHACLQSLTQRNCAVLCNGWHLQSHSCGQRAQRDFLLWIDFPFSNFYSLFFLLDLTPKFDLPVEQIRRISSWESMETRTVKVKWLTEVSKSSLK